MSSNEPIEVRLRAACYEYYVAQQALMNAEGDSLELQSVATRLKQSLEAERSEAKRLKDILELINAERFAEEQSAKLAHTHPHLAGVKDLDAYLAKEKALYARISDALEARQTLEAQTSQLLKRAQAEASSLRLLEEAADAQQRHNRKLCAEHKDFKGRFATASDRLGKAIARREQLELELKKTAEKESQLKMSCRARSARRDRAQDELKERDMDAIRLRRDHSFAERLRLSEVEHSREQDLTIEHLVAENKRLRKKVADRRDGRPVLRQDQEARLNAWSPTRQGGSADAPEFDARPQQQPVEAGSTSPLFATRRGGRAPYQPIAVISNDDIDLFAAVDGRIGPNGMGRPLGELSMVDQRKLLEKARDRNVALLQQMVSSMKMLEMQVAKPPV